MSADDRRRWDEKYREKPAPTKIAPDDWLVQHVTGRPVGRAVEFACGLGQNAIWLAQLGWTVDAIDISTRGLKLAAESARRHNAAVNWIAADLDEFTPADNAYDLVLVFRFLDRRRVPRLTQRALRPGGILIYETYTVAHLARSGSPMQNPAFALSRDEMPRLFPELELVEYAEVELADRSVARFVGRKSVAY